MKLIYIMPPFITTNEQLQKLVDAIYGTVEKLQD